MKSSRYLDYQIRDPSNFWLHKQLIHFRSGNRMSTASIIGSILRSLLLIFEEINRHTGKNS